ncbi:uncharacterized protein LOC142331571 [Lycorma delicatula]|uniref:uncharacterized protein LOC142331571 n=1 Tax=Lycorma delicatula TaxID=130591 RepID=UPI003F511B3B
MSTTQDTMMMHVRWRHHQSGLLSYLRQMLVSEIFVDVTLCCQGKRLKAHRVLLSASSPYLQALLLAHPTTEQTTIILHDVQYDDMRSLLDFIYTGGVIIPEERLPSFLSAAEALNITVLTDKQLYKTIPATEEWQLAYKSVPPLIKMDSSNRWNNRSIDIDLSKQNEEMKYSPDYLAIQQNNNNNNNNNNNINDMKPFLDIKTAMDTTTSRCSSYSDSSEDSQRRSIDSGLEVLNSPSYCYDVKTKQEDLRCLYHHHHHHLHHNHNHHHPDKDDNKRFVINNTSSSDLEQQWLRPLPSLIPVVNHPNTIINMNMNINSINSPPTIYSSTHRTTRYYSSRHSLGGILTPSPWSQYGRPPVGAPRKPPADDTKLLSSLTTSDGLSNTDISEPKNLMTDNTNEVKDLSKINQGLIELSMNHQITKPITPPITLPVVPISQPKLENDENKQQNKNNENNIIKLCKLKERRLQEFYREQKNIEISPKGMNYKPDEALSPSYKINLNIPPLNENNNDKEISTVNKSLKIDSDWNYEKQEKDLLINNNNIKTNNTKILMNNSSNNVIENNKITPEQNIRQDVNDTRMSAINDRNNNSYRHNEDISSSLCAINNSNIRQGCNDCNTEFSNKNKELLKTTTITPQITIENNSGNNKHQTTKLTTTIPTSSSGFICTICKKSFLQKNQLTTHHKLHHEFKNPEHSCSHCGKAFLTKASLKVHLRTHTGEKPFHCNECGKQFSQLRNYKYHRSVHEGTKEFAATCPECGKYFNDRGYLSSHMKIHRNRKEYGCEYCGKCFNQRVAYNMHVRIHTGVKPHVCPHCSKSFSRKMLLKQHLRIHTGEKPFTCVVCQKAFADRSNMTLHMRLHSGIKPYTCNICSKSFTKKHHLKTHMNYHTGVKPYACSKCGLRFSQSSNMRTHFKKCSSTPQTQESHQVTNNNTSNKEISVNNSTNESQCPSSTLQKIKDEATLK